MRSGNLQKHKTPCKIPFRKICTACFDFSEREEIEARGERRASESSTFHCMYFWIIWEIYANLSMTFF